MASNTRWANGLQFAKNLRKRLKDSGVTVGVQKSAGQHDESDAGVTVAQVGFWNEFGTETSPERSFMRSTVADNREAYRQIMRKIVNREVQLVAAGSQSVFSRDLGKFGQKVQNDIQARIVSIRTPPNAPSTVAAKKGVNNPLVDSNQLLNSIRWARIDE